MRARLADERGSAAIELVGFLPFLLLAGLMVWQMHVTVTAGNEVANAARTAARALSLGGDARATAMRALPPNQRDHARVIVQGQRVEVITRTPLINTGVTFRHDLRADATIPGD